MIELLGNLSTYFLEVKFRPYLSGKSFWGLKPFLVDYKLQIYFNIKFFEKNKSTFENYF